MRQAILTEAERKAIQRFRKDKEKTGIIRVTAGRTRRHIEVLRDDLALLEFLLNNYGFRKKLKAGQTDAKL